MSDDAQWTWYLAALAGNRGPVYDGEPMTGFYRCRFKDKRTCDVDLYAIAYWHEAGTLYCKRTRIVDGRVLSDFLEDLRALEQWTFACRAPVTHETYLAFCKTGLWPDQHEAATADRRSVESARNSGNAPDLESFEGLSDRISDLSREAGILISGGAAKTQEQSDCAADLADRLRKLEKTAGKAFVKERTPHDDAVKAVRSKWSPIIAKADEFKARLKDEVVTPFLKTQEQGQEAAQAVAIQSGKPAEAVTPAKRTAGTTSSVALRPHKSAIIEDYPATLAHFADHEKVRELIQQLANAAARADTCPPGCKINTEYKAA